jgi:hypothetical protein
MKERGCMQTNIRSISQRMFVQWVLSGYISQWGLSKQERLFVFHEKKGKNKCKMGAWFLRARDSKPKTTFGTSPTNGPQCVSRTGEPPNELTHVHTLDTVPDASGYLERFPRNGPKRGSPSYCVARDAREKSCKKPFLPLKNLIPHTHSHGEKGAAAVNYTQDLCSVGLEQVWKPQLRQSSYFLKSTPPTTVPQCHSEVVNSHSGACIFGTARRIFANEAPI